MNILIIISALILINIAFILMLGRTQGLQRAGAVLLVLTLAIGSCSIFGFMQAKSYGIEQYSNMYKLSFEGAYTYMQTLENNQEIYTFNTQETLEGAKDAVTSALPIVTVGDKTFSYVNLVLAQKNESSVYQSVYEDCQDANFWADNSATAGKLIDRAVKYQTSQSKQLSNGNIMLVITDKTRVTTNYALVAEVSTSPLNSDFNSIKIHYYVLSLICILVGILITGLVIFFQDKDMKKMLKILTKVSEGNADYEELKQYKNSTKKESYEIHTLRSGLWQIASNVEWMNYTKYRVLQAYFRFAPKNIEKMLGRESILDVQPMDRVSAEGTLAFVSFSIDEKQSEREILRQMNQNYQLLGQVRKEYEGVILSSSTDLSVIQLMFNEQTLKALNFGIKLVTGELSDETASQAFLLLHRTPFVYGVAGDDEQAFTYVHSNEMKVLEKYVDDLKNMGVRMVITDYVQEITEKETTTRYIGYIENGEYTFNLYEVLDALSSSERQKRIDLKAKFSQALTLFYKSDFYLARSTFSEILRSCPTDEVAKWYLFLCENSLNGQDTDRQSFALFQEK